MKRNTVMQFEFDKEIYTANDTVLVGFALPNILYFIAMLFGCIMPLGVTIGLCTGISIWVAILQLSKIAFIMQASGWKSVAALLKFYPTKKHTVRVSRYTLLFRSMLLELILTGLPMILFFYWFNIIRFTIALFTVAVTMTVIYILGVELSLSR
ncbi:hypothetical protein HNQ56_002203 [Anaerotaenia torta]|uniref:hypothetical protein n=1 Tax=Anaerotaenia torta TaxID=433293 RepID=UPI003D235572